MKRKIIIFGAIFIAVLAGAFLFYFLYFGNPSRQILAQVNDEKITVEQFNKEVAKVEDPLREMLQEEPLQFLEGMITKRLLLQEAKKQGFSAPVKTFKDTAKDSLPPEEALVMAFIEKKFSLQPEVTPKEIEGFYSIFKGQMGGKTLKEAAPIIEQILREGKQRESAEQFIKELRNAAKIEIDQGRIKKISVKPPE